MRRKPRYSSDAERLLTLALRHAVEPDSGMIPHWRLATILRGWSSTRILAAIDTAGLHPTIQVAHSKGGVRGKLYRASDAREALDRILAEREAPPPEKPRVWERPAK